MARYALIVLAALLLTGCGTQFPAAPAVPADSAAAVALLDRSIAAHGGYLYDRPDTVSVSYDGRWRRAVKVLQPVIVDAEFRQRSDEFLDLQNDRFLQSHFGPSGEKTVERSSDGLAVLYNGEESLDSDVRDAAALVADAYEMFLTGPSFFRKRQAQLSLLEPAIKDGRSYQRLHARLQPGFGFSDEDRAVIWIDDETGLMSLVHFTIDGTATTRGAHVDVAFSDHREVGGYVWPLSFFERVRGPVRVAAHSWYVTALAVSGDPSGSFTAKKDEG